MKIIYFTILMSIIAIRTMLAQSIAISSNYSVAEPLCPGLEYSYTFTPPSGVICTIAWTVAGEYDLISSGLNQNPLRLKWKSTNANNVGTVSVSATYASSSQNCGSANSTSWAMISKIRTVHNRTLGSPSISPAATNYCTNTAVTLSVPVMQVQGTSQNVDAYEWVLPDGWTQSVTNYGGTVLTPTNQITIVPGSCAVSSSVTVRAVTGTTWCTAAGAAGQSRSLATTINLVRNPALAITPPSGFTGVQCGLRNDLVFSVTSLACTTQYEWILPDANWTLVSQSGNSVTIKPSGTSGGTLKARITININGVTCKLDIPFTIPFNATTPYPSISLSPTPGSPYEFCNSESYTMTAALPAGYPTNFGFDWFYESNYGTKNAVTFDGVTAIKSAPYHTVNNSVTLAIPGSSFGDGWINVRLNNLGTCQSVYTKQERKIGPYSNSEFYFSGPNTYCPNTAVDFVASIISSGGVTGYTWTKPTGWSASGQSTPYWHVSLPGNFTSGQITLKLQNRCGWTNTPYVMTISKSANCNARIAMAPNPAGDKLTVSELEVGVEAQVQLLDKDGKKVSDGNTKDGQLSIDVSKIPNGTYYLVITQKGATDTERIIINH